jgi:hypothetical protein
VDGERQVHGLQRCGDTGGFAIAASPWPIRYCSLLYNLGFHLEDLLAVIQQQCT